MTEIPSRIVLTIEALLLGVPVTLLSPLASLPVDPAIDRGWSFLVTRLIIFAGLLCGWVLMLVFIARGGQALRKLSNYWWWLPLLNGGLVLCYLLFVWLVGVQRQTSLMFYGWGTPLLIPLGHLCIERWFRPSANPPLNRTRADNARAG